jgi:hypothetical protein
MIAGFALNFDFSCLATLSFIDGCDVFIVILMMAGFLTTPDTQTEQRLCQGGRESGGREFCNNLYTIQLVPTSAPQMW